MALTFLCFSSGFWLLIREFSRFVNWFYWLNWLNWLNNWTSRMNVLVADLHNQPIKPIKLIEQAFRPLSLNL